VREPPEDDGDAILMERVRRGDARAFDALVMRHRTTAYRVAHRLVARREDAEDVVQEAFLSVLKYTDGFRRESAFRPWFLRIVANRARNLLRSRKVRDADEIPAEAPSPAPSPEWDAERRELAARIAAGVQRLDPVARQAVQLFYVDGLSGAEVAAVLNLSHGTVRWHLHRARARLREVLGELVLEENR
jgi:RNA polymerase sigma-70 factor, ECF subfamily